MLLEILFGSELLLPGNELDLKFRVDNLTEAADEGRLLAGLPAWTESLGVDTPEGVAVLARRLAKSARFASLERLRVFAADSGEGEVGWE